MFCHWKGHIYFQTQHFSFTKHVEDVNLKSVFLIYKQYNSYNSICKAYDYIHFIWATIVIKWAKEGQSTPRNGYNMNDPAWPTGKNVVDKFFASRDVPGSWLTSSTHPFQLHVEGRILFTSALSDLSLSAEYLCPLLIALSVK